MSPPRSDRTLLQTSESQKAREARQAGLRDLQIRAWNKSVRRMLLQCILLMLLGAPLYGFAWHLTDPAQTRIVVAAALFVSYATPLVRLLIFHIRATGRGDY